MRNMKLNRQNLHDSCLMFRGTEQWSKVEGSARSAWLSTLPGDPPNSHHAFTLSQPLWLLLVTPTSHSETGTFTYTHTHGHILQAHFLPLPLSFFYWGCFCSGSFLLASEEKLLSSGLSAFTHLSSFLVMSHKGDLQSTFSPSPVFT